MKRGILNKAALEISKEFLGVELTTTQLRLLPYIMFLGTDNRPVDAIRVSSEEMEVLDSWVAKGYISGPESGDVVKISREFWNFISSIIFETYVSKIVENDKK